MFRVSARRLSIYNFTWEPKSQKKILEHQFYQSKQKISKKKTVFRTLKVKRGQNTKKNYRNIKSTNQNEIFPNKCMFSTLKV
jgi:hypothetical protein